MKTNWKVYDAALLAIVIIWAVVTIAVDLITGGGV